jgi:hypothetical protein
MFIKRFVGGDVPALRKRNASPLVMGVTGKNQQKNPSNFVQKNRKK